MGRRYLLACVFVGWAAGSSHAQVPYASDLLPSRSALARLGLERHWVGVVPLRTNERVIELSIAGNMAFAQTNMANFHAFDSESGQLLWSANLGQQTGDAQPASVNSYAVFVTNGNYLFSLDRKTGRVIWSQKLEAVPSSPTACDEERVMVGIASGKVVAYLGKLQTIPVFTRTKEGIETTRIERKRTPNFLWNWQTNGQVTGRVEPAGPAVVFGSTDGKVYASLAETPTMLYRFATGGPVTAPIGAYGTRTMLVPSTDKNVYAVDLWAAKAIWVFSTGAPVEQEPLVADDDVYIVNKAGILSAVDAQTGTLLWTTSTHGGRLMAISKALIYLESHDEDLFIVDRATGRIVADPRATRSRAGLDLREYALGTTNSLNDRIYIGTHSGVVVCLREMAQVKPRPLRELNSKPFGYIPPEGIKVLPDGTPSIPGHDPVLPATDNAAPAEEKKEGEPPAEKPEKEEKEKEEK